MSQNEAMTTLLAGRKALVTGASRRLGRAMAIALARHGATPALHFRGAASGAQETAAIIAKLGTQAPVVSGDLADADQCTALVGAAHDALGGLDILINNAAIFERTPIDEMTIEHFDRHMDVNARSVYALSLEAGKRMRAAGGGDIINIACVSAWRPYPAYVPYSASKAAVVNLTQGFAKALAPTVRVNAIAPGPILPAAGELEGQGKRAVEHTLLKRWGEPDDIAQAMLFLLRATYVNGFTLAVDGGRSIA